MKITKITHGIETELLTAVKSQRKWADQVLKLKQYRKLCTSSEIWILKRIRNEGQYLYKNKKELNSIMDRITKFNKNDEQR